MDTKNVIKTLSQSLLDEVKKVMKKEKNETAADEKAECSEELKGGQKKIDANHNGKLDAHDFKLLRKKKGVAETYAEAVKNPYAVGMAAAEKSTGDTPPLKKSTIVKGHEIAKKIMKNEEVEELDELSHSTLRSYRMKAKSIADHGGELRTKGRELASKKSYGGRILGVEKAKVMAKEEVEDLEELSKGTLAKYAHKAKDRLDSAAYRSGIAFQTRVQDGKYTKREAELEKKADKRSRGLDMAINKLAKEEVEVEESKNTPYVKPHIEKGSTQQTAWKASNKHGRVKYFGMDFKKSAEKHAGISEEVEDLDELSKGTLASYIKKAGRDAAQADDSAEHLSGLANKWKDKMTNSVQAAADKKTAHSKKRVKGIIKAAGKLATEEVEQIDELSPATKDSYAQKAGKQLPGLFKKSGKSEEGARKYYNRKNTVRKIANEEIELTQEELDRLDAIASELDEGRGRPPKEGSAAWKARQEAGAAAQNEPSQHPIQQLEKIKHDMRGGGDFTHKDGSTHHLTGSQASKILDKYHGLKPSEKESMQKEIHANHAGLKKHL